MLAIMLVGTVCIFFSLVFVSPAKQKRDICIAFPAAAAHKLLSSFCV